jgi:hypothetical protein
MSEYGSSIEHALHHANFFFCFPRSCFNNSPFRKSAGVTCAPPPMGFETRKKERKKHKDARVVCLCRPKRRKKKPRKQRRETETCNRNPMPLPNGPRHSSGLSRTAWIRLHDTDFCVYFTVIVTTGSIGRSQAKAKKLTIFAVASKPT